MSNVHTIQNILNSNTPFWASEDYHASSKSEFGSAKLAPVVYEVETEKRWVRIGKRVISVIIFPIGLYQLIHSLAGKLILPSSSSKYRFETLRMFNRGRDSKNQFKDWNVFRAALIPKAGDDNWKVKRITIRVDGQAIDAVIMGKAATLNNGRWMLYSGGNGESYETTLATSKINPILSEINANAILFNYPGVAASEGMANRTSMEKTYRAMLNFLEDKKNGVGAKEIVGYGFSIGGGVQGSSLHNYKFKADVKYAFVKDRSFSTLRQTVSKILSPPLGGLTALLGWNFDSVKSSSKLSKPEIIIQAGIKTLARDITNEKFEDFHPNFFKRETLYKMLVSSDGVIHEDATLASELLKMNKAFPAKKILVTERWLEHCDDFRYITSQNITNAILEALKL